MCVLLCKIERYYFFVLKVYFDSCDIRWTEYSCLYKIFNHFCVMSFLNFTFVKMKVTLINSSKSNLSYDKNLKCAKTLSPQSTTPDCEPAWVSTQQRERPVKLNDETPQAWAEQERRSEAVHNLNTNDNGNEDQDICFANLSHESSWPATIINWKRRIGEKRKHSKDKYSQPLI